MILTMKTNEIIHGICDVIYFEFRCTIYCWYALKLVTIYCTAINTSFRVLYIYIKKATNHVSLIIPFPGFLLEEIADK